MGQLALEQTASDEVWYIPAPAPPHKLESVHSDYDVRVQMTQALIEGYFGLRVSELESRLSQPSYTVDTLRACRELYPDIHFQFLLGSDSLAQLPTWHEAVNLTQLVEFVVAVRAGFEYEKTMEDVAQLLPNIRARVVEMPMVDVSSTFVRDRLQHRRSLCGLVPVNVMDIWLAHHHGETVDGGETAGE
jgi:nicotinate-nucleotide adenylyltransferase